MERELSFNMGNKRSVKTGEKINREKGKIETLLILAKRRENKIKIKNVCLFVFISCINIDQSKKTPLVFLHFEIIARLYVYN